MNTYTAIIAALALASACDPCSAIERSISPIELLQSDREALFDSTTRFRVQFEIAAVHRMPTHFPDGTKHDVPQLVPVNGSGFTVPLSREIEATLQRIGIDDLDKHFTGKTISVEGIVGQTGLDLIGSETTWTFHITIRSLDQILGLHLPAQPRAKRAAVERPTFGNLAEFFEWADPLLADKQIHTILAAQSGRVGSREGPLRSLRQLRSTLDGKSLSEVFAGTEFSKAYKHFKLGGHNKELGHCHIDFVQNNGRWMLDRIWHCR